MEVVKEGDEFWTLPNIFSHFFGFVASQAGAGQSRVVSPPNTTALPFVAAKTARAGPAQIRLPHNGDNLSNSE